MVAWSPWKNWIRSKVTVARPGSMVLSRTGVAPVGEHSRLGVGRAAGGDRGLDHGAGGRGVGCRRGVGIGGEGEVGTGGDGDGGEGGGDDDAGWSHDDLSLQRRPCRA